MKLINLIKEHQKELDFDLKSFNMQENDDSRTLYKLPINFRQNEKRLDDESIADFKKQLIKNDFSKMAIQEWNVPIKNQRGLENYQLMEKNDTKNKSPVKRHDEYLRNLPAIQTEENLIKIPMSNNQETNLEKWSDKQYQKVDQNHLPNQQVIKENVIRLPPTPLNNINLRLNRPMRNKTTVLKNVQSKPNDHTYTKNEPIRANHKEDSKTKNSNQNEIMKPNSSQLKLVNKNDVENRPHQNIQRPILENRQQNKVQKKAVEKSKPVVPYNLRLNLTESKPANDKYVQNAATSRIGQDVHNRIHFQEPPKENVFRLNQYARPRNKQPEQNMKDINQRELDTVKNFININNLRPNYGRNELNHWPEQARNPKVDLGKWESRPASKNDIKNLRNLSPNVHMDSYIQNMSLINNQEKNLGNWPPTPHNEVSLGKWSSYDGQNIEKYQYNLNQIKQENV